ncbi:MAG: hypothetical protein PHV75_01675 [Victivallaceae bacterium]|nr:hypothetical protein [Victivallaceae bacterium]MDD3116463.1 hypothetical protein [Victivallaceae bacterium]MDD3703166.1 hypothetical protein [Victivallaceae bacterium]MDD4317206.1 hypothetical protein [Victivallaceae bacterium]
MSRIIRLILLAMGIAVSGIAAEPENLLPPVSKQKEPGEHWIIARTQSARAKFSTEEIDGKSALKVEIDSDSGYAFWRVMKKLEPGVYTSSVICRGRVEHKTGPGWEIYSFDKDGKAKMIHMRTAPSGQLDTTIVTGKFTVPADSVSVRIGLGFSGRGVAWFLNPAIYKGGLSILKEPVAENTVTVEPPATSWMAEWLWVKEQKDAPRAIFSREYVLNEEPSCGMVQITADNGYSLKVNGKDVDADMDWKTVRKVDITSMLKKGVNRIVIDMFKIDGFAGCIMQGHVWNREGKIIETLKTDMSWSVEIPGSGQTVTMESQGVPPVQPWRNIPFLRLLPAKNIILQALSTTDTVRQGDIFVLNFKYQEEFPISELKDLKLVFYDNAGNRSALSAFDPVIRYEERIKQIFIELPISRFAAPDTYEWKLEGVTFNIIPHTRNVSLKLGALPSFERNPAVHFSKKPTNIMKSAGGDHAPFTYSTVTPSAQNYFNWTHTGGHMYEVALASGYRTADGRIDLSAMEQNMLQILEGDPHASIYLKININVPGWWGLRYPDELFVSNRNRRALQSFCSEIWRQNSIDFVNDIIKSLENRPVGVSVSGVLLMGFRGGEFQLWGENVGEYDCSAPAQKAFSTWQRKKQVSPEIELPHPALEYPFQEGENYDLIRKNFFQFVAERSADNITWFASEFKKQHGDKYSFGVYYGYPMEHSASLKRMLFSGHLGIQKVLNEAPLDIISCPASYSLRRLNLSHAYMNPVDSALLHGIMPILENDIRNYATKFFGDSSGTTVFSLRDSQLTSSKLNLLAAAHGTVVRYYAIIEGMDFFAPLPMIKSIAQENRLLMKLKPAPLGMKDQVAMVIDTMSWASCASPAFNDQITRKISELRDTLMRTGRSVAFITIDDWEKNAERWENVVIPLPGVLSQSRKEFLEKTFEKLPTLKLNDVFMVLRKGEKTLVCDDTKEVWQATALPQVLSSEMKNVWYVGGNFTAIWDGNKLDIKINDK